MGFRLCEIAGLAIVAALAAGHALAQDGGRPAAAPLPGQLDMAGAVALTLARHPEIAKANAALARGRADLGAAKAAWTPQLSYQANVGPHMLSGRNGSGLNENMAGPSVYLQQQVWDFGRSKGEIGAARATTGQRWHELESVADQLAEQGALAFLEVKRFEALSSEAGKQVAELEQLRQKIGLRVNAGISDKSDLMLADVRVESARGDAIQAETSLGIAKAALANLTGGPAQHYADPAAQISRFEAGDQEPDYASLPAIVAAEKAERAAAAKIGQAKAERYPRLGLQLGYTRNNYSYNVRDNSFTALVTVTGDLYRRSNHYLVTAAEEDRRAAQATREAAILDMRGRALTARQEIRAGQARITAYSLQERQAVTASRIFFEEYKLGKRTLTELLNTQLEIYRAASARIVAEHDIMEARVKFETLRGTLRPSLGLPARFNEQEDPDG
ncbi:TolC family protein [Sphingobium sp.]|uniref:TolC family protein n=1 Tax=Sphingobium sp. TaxID=1912891 RepID=UPI0035C73C6A